MYEESERQEITEDAMRQGRAYAARCGLSVEDQKDCAQLFVIKVLISERYEQYRWSGHSPGLMASWAKNHAYDFRRMLLREQCHIIPLKENETLEDLEKSTQEAIGVNRLMREEIRQELHKAIQLLTPLQQQILKRRVFNGESMKDIAASLNKTVKALSMTLQRAYFHLHSILLRKGWDESEVAFCLALFATPPLNACFAFIGRFSSLPIYFPPGENDPWNFASWIR